MHTSFRLSFLPAILWLVFVSILFCLPGSALPSAGWMGDIHMDKWVHVGIFTLLCFFWGRALLIGPGQPSFWLWIIAVAYGLLIEIVQDQFISNRSFDLWDLLADGIGGVAGLWLWRYIKNKPL